MVTIAFHKPYDVLSQFTDRHSPPRRTLADFVELPNVYGAGRLDRDSEGLLILSDDERLRTLLTDSRNATPKTYWVQVEGIPGEEALAELRSGVVVKGVRTRRCEAALLDPAPLVAERSVPIRVRKSVPDRWVEVTITEGRNRQVRRMTAAVGHPTLRLIRVQIGPIELGDLAPGQWREISSSELTELQRKA